MKKVYVVHCIDTEGPLHESLEATVSVLDTNKNKFETKYLNKSK